MQVSSISGWKCQGLENAGSLNSRIANEDCSLRGTNSNSAFDSICMQS